MARWTFPASVGYKSPNRHELYRYGDCMNRPLTLTALVFSGVGIVVAAQTGNPPQPNPDTTGIAPILTTSNGGDLLYTDGGNARILAGEAQTKGTFVVMESVQRAGAWTTEHNHRFAESFYVVEGALTVQINGGEPRQMGPGSYVFIPGGVRHAQGNTGTVPVKTVLTTQPAGLERRFRAQSEEMRKLREAEQGPANPK
jgi:quercetin dioxygenase-like cupin family protein